MFGEADDEGRIRTEATIKGMNLLSYTAQNIAVREMNFGADGFLKYKEQSEFPYVSANWIFRDTGKPVAEPFVTKEYHSSTFLGMKTSSKSIGFIGLNRKNDGALFKTSDGREIIVEDPKKALRKYIPELKKDCRIVVVLARMDLADAMSLIDDVPGIDVMLISYSARTTSKIEKKGSTYYAFTGNLGKRLGELRLYLDDDKEKIVRTFLSMNYLKDGFPDDRKQKIIQDEYLLKINELKKKTGNAAGPTGDTFATAESCRKCHQKEYDIWAKSRHAAAFSTLEKSSQHFNKKCIGCHTLGYLRPDGFLNKETTPDLINVQCENCHGALSGHASKRSTKPSKGGNNCKSCHNSEQSPDFEYQKYWEKIKH